jgi:hypothetical protein
LPSFLGGILKYLMNSLQAPYYSMNYPVSSWITVENFNINIKKKGSQHYKDWSNITTKYSTVHDGLALFCINMFVNKQTTDSMDVQTCLLSPLASCELIKYSTCVLGSLQIISCMCIFTNEYSEMFCNNINGIPERFVDFLSLKWLFSDWTS